MAEYVTGLREIGAGYLGKEPHEYVTDVLRGIIRLSGQELGFEGCLTSRPFTSRTYVEERPGAMLPGRSHAAGAERARCDLADGLAVLAGFGYRHVSGGPAVLPADVGPGRTALIGPVRVDDRWCPTADRIITGAAWRYLVVEKLAGHGLICFDVLSGGYIGPPRPRLAIDDAEVTLVEAPAHPPDVTAVAQGCLSAGLAWRATESDITDRNGAGLSRCLESPARLLAGGSGHRLGLALQGYALQAWRWSALLGWAEASGMNSLALADALHDSVLECRAAHKAVMGGNAAVLEERLRRLAALADAITDLSLRMASTERS
jgi:hypothetical protein